MLSMIPDSPIDYVSGQKPNTEVETRYFVTSIFFTRDIVISFGLELSCHVGGGKIAHNFI